MTSITIASVLARITADPGRPRLTWYADGERIDLSGAVVANWVNKSANLLLDEIDAGPGTTVGISLPTHWRAVVWTMAVLRTGATVMVIPPSRLTDGAACDLIVTDKPTDELVARTIVVAQPLAALARSFAGLPSGAIDAGSAVMTYGDTLGFTQRAEPDRPAVITASGECLATHANLGTPWEGLARVLVLDGGATGASAAPHPSVDGAGSRRGEVTATDADNGVAVAIDPCLRILAGDGSVVLLSRSGAAATVHDAAAIAHLTDVERITEVWSGVSRLG